MKFIITKSIAFASFALLASTTIAAGNGSSPKGKPFIELQGQIYEVQSDITSLQSQYNVIMAKIAALELADDNLQGQIDAINAEINILKAKDSDLEGKIATLMTEVANQGIDIQSLVDSYVSLNDQLSQLEQATGDNTLAITQIESDLAVVTDSIATNAAGLITLISQVEDNAELIALLQDDIARLDIEKQNAISGSCTGNNFVKTINNDGSVECGYADANGVLQTVLVYGPSIDLDRYVNYIWTCHWWGCHYHSYTVTGDGTAYANCPTGYRVTGGGFHLYDQKTGNVRVRYTLHYTTSSWRTYFENISASVTSGYYGNSYAVCAKL